MNGLILIVEDEDKLARLLSEYLEQSGYQVVYLGDGDSVLPWVKSHTPDLILLDLMLPNRDGLDICREIRSFSALPIIMITARIEEIDRLLGLELGADDYICKPFSPREVVARVKAVLKRTGGNITVSEAGLLLDEHRYLATLHGINLGLTAVEFKLLQLLYANPGRIYSRNQLMDNIYPNERIVSDRTIDSHVKKLRRKIDVVTPDKELIHSVYGVGYKFELPPTAYCQRETSP